MQHFFLVMLLNCWIVIYRIDKKKYFITADNASIDNDDDDEDNEENNDNDDNGDGEQW